MVLTTCTASSTRNTTSKRDGMMLSTSTCGCAWDGEVVMMTMMRRFVVSSSKIVALNHIATYLQLARELWWDRYLMAHYCRREKRLFRRLPRQYATHITIDHIPRVRWKWNSFFSGPFHEVLVLQRYYGFAECLALWTMTFFQISNPRIQLQCTRIFPAS